MKVSEEEKICFGKWYPYTGGGLHGEVQYTGHQVLLPPTFLLSTSRLNLLVSVFTLCGLHGQPCLDVFCLGLWKFNIVWCCYISVEIPLHKDRWCHKRCVWVGGCLPYYIKPMKVDTTIIHSAFFSLFSCYIYLFYSFFYFFHSILHFCFFLSIPF